MARLNESEGLAPDTVPFKKSTVIYPSSEAVASAKTSMWYTPIRKPMPLAIESARLCPSDLSLPNFIEWDFSFQVKCDKTTFGRFETTLQQSIAHAVGFSQLVTGLHKLLIVRLAKGRLVSCRFKPGGQFKKPCVRGKRVQVMSCS